MTIKKQSHTLRASILFLTLTSLAGCRGITTGSTQALTPEVEGAIYVGAAICCACHTDTAANMKNSVHFRISDTQPDSGCEACHGPGSRHAALMRRGTAAEDELPAIIDFKQLSPEAAADICLKCHRETAASGELPPLHDTADAGCLDCHTAHGTAHRNTLRFQGTQLCFNCHPEKRAAFSLPSHHPLHESKIQCRSCHRLHGRQDNFSDKKPGRQRCLACHAEYGGPFVYEHEPVVEDCMICHEPHGTIANNLLKQNQPFLCLRCHRGHRQDMHEQYPRSASFLTSCSQCHSQVHGSDLPSAVYGRGRTR
ncbi:MAG: DmsE family decaheme c-type cytochrome [Deltaproteobacteria bacterium]|nr:DmsE family decaheme c-type cytochrome [Deltaproteobacteria bacterium]